MDVYEKPNMVLVRITTLKPSRTRGQFPPQFQNLEEKSQF
jgi:hypothetical protein